MIEIKNCPSSLVEGFDTYSPRSAKLLFGKTKVNPILRFDIDEFQNVGEIADAMHRISVSGVQEIMKLINSIRRFGENISIWFSYFPVLWIAYDFDYSSILSVNAIR